MELTSSMVVRSKHGKSFLTRDIDSLPEPATMLNVQHSLPPRSRSPIKTSIGSPRKSQGGSPRKSMGLLSSPAVRPRNGTPNHDTSQNEPSSIVGIAAESLAQSIERDQRKSAEKQLERSPLAAKASKAKHTTQKGRKQIFDIESDEYDEPEQTQEQSTTDIAELPPMEDEEDEEPVVDGDDSLEIPTDDDENSVQLGLGATSATRGPPGRGAKGKGGGISVSKSKANKRATNGDQQSSGSEAEESLNLDPPIGSEVKKRGGRPQKAKQAEAIKPLVYRDPDGSIEEESSRPAKRAKTESGASTPPKRRPPPSARDPNVQIVSRSQSKDRSRIESEEPPPAKASEREGKSKARAKETPDMMPPPPPPPKSSRGTSTDVTYERGRPKPRGLQILRSTTPANEDGAKFTRSGRATIKPIEYWRGERVVFSKPKNLGGGRVSLPSIQEVVRAEDLPEEPRPRVPRSRKKRRRQEEEEEDEGDDEDAEEWELEAGVLEGEVWQWDPEAERGSTEVLEQTGISNLIHSSLANLLNHTVSKNDADLAIAPLGLQNLVKEVKNQSFEYAKTITLPFFHSGMVDIPPQGEKRTKNSRKNHMVFWVFAGRVVVDVSGNEFSVGRGGMWQVPRG